MKRKSPIKAGLALFLGFIAPLAMASESLWQDVDRSAIQARGTPWVQPAESRTVVVNLDGFRNLVRSAPVEGRQAARDSQVVLSLPTPDGHFQRFGVLASPVMEPELAAKYPGIQTFAGQGLDDPTATLRIGVSHLGLNAQVLSANGSYFIDPFQLGDDLHHSVYTRAGFGTNGKGYRCATHDTDTGAIPETDLPVTPLNPAGASLRTYRLAIASTSSYTNAFGGTVADGLAGLTTLVNRLNGI